MLKDTLTWNRPEHVRLNQNEEKQSSILVPETRVCKNLEMSKDIENVFSCEVKRGGEENQEVKKDELNQPCRQQTHTLNQTSIYIPTHTHTHTLIDQGRPAERSSTVVLWR